MKIFYVRLLSLTNDDYWWFLVVANDPTHAKQQVAMKFQWFNGCDCDVYDFEEANEIKDTLPTTDDLSVPYVHEFDSGN